MLTPSKSHLASLWLVVAATAVTPSTGVSTAAAAGGLRPAGPATAIASSTLTYVSYNEYANAMLVAVNNQRATQGLPALCLNQKLHAAAQRHSNDMAAHDFMDHIGSDGSRMSQRVTDAGYDWAATSENVAAGHIDVATVMTEWIHSPGHLENIMGDYTMFGSAYAFNLHGTRQHYWTQNFGSSDTESCDPSVTDAATTVRQGATQRVEQHVQTATGTVGAPTPVRVPNVRAPAPAPAPIPAPVPAPAPAPPTTATRATPRVASKGSVPGAFGSLFSGYNVPVTYGSMPLMPSVKVPLGTEGLPPTTGPDSAVDPDCQSHF